MDISLVVCTRNRATQLGEALPYFARLQTGASWEIVFVNNGSTDYTSEVLAEFIKSSGVDAKVVGQPKVGLSAARNAGWRRSSGGLVAFTDDDCYPTPDYLDQICACFAEADLGYLGGRILLFDKNDFPITIQPLERRVDISPRSFVPAGLIHGANFAFRREALELVGDFDEKLGAGTKLHCGEDVDMLARVSALGLSGAYDPRPTVFHRHRRSKLEDVNRLRAGYDIGRGAYYAKALMDRRSRSAFLRPIFWMVRKNIVRRDFARLRRELYGAWMYIFG